MLSSVAYSVRYSTVEIASSLRSSQGHPKLVIASKAKQSHLLRIRDRICATEHSENAVFLYLLEQTSVADFEKDCCLRPIPAGTVEGSGNEGLFQIPMGLLQGQR